jgi:phosphoenolpyruvate-protein kinase (PTS system EI component)
MARDERMLRLFIGLGIHILSMDARNIPALQAAIAQLSAEECKAFAKRALRCSTVADSAALLGMD